MRTTAAAPLLAVAQILLSGPTVMLSGSVKPTGRGNSVITGGFPGATRPSLSVASSANQRLPSGPSTMSCGCEASVGIANSVTVGAAAAGDASARRISAAASPLREFFIQGLVDQLVRALVLLSPDRAHGPLVESPQLSHGFGEQGLESRVLHL